MDGATRMNVRQLTEKVGPATVTAARVTGAAVRGGLRLAVARSGKLPEKNPLPPGGLIHLEGRGDVYVVDTGEPHPGAPVVLLLHAVATTASLSLVHHGRRPAGRLPGRADGPALARSRRASRTASACRSAPTTSTRSWTPWTSTRPSSSDTRWAERSPRSSRVSTPSGSPAWCSAPPRRPGRATRPRPCSTRCSPPSPRWAGGTRPRRSGSTPTRSPPLTDIEDDVAQWAWSEFRSTSFWSLPEVLGELGRFDARGTRPRSRCRPPWS